MTGIQSEIVEEILESCAEKHILPRFRTLEDHEIRTKSNPTDLVTDADVETEETLIRILPKLIPGSVVVGEESVSKDERLLDVLQDDEKTIWVVDPVDGTRNFTKGDEFFCSMVALVQGGETIQSWIYDVPARKFAVCEKGAGAFYGGKRLQTSESKPVNELHGYFGKAYAPEELGDRVEAKKDELGQFYCLHCAGHEYITLANGEMDFALFGRINPWDHLPGILLTQESGGFVMKSDRTLYMPKDGRRQYLLSASCQNVWESLSELFF